PPRVKLRPATAERVRQAGMQPAVSAMWLRRLRGFEVGAFEGPARKSYSHSHVLARSTSSQQDLEELLMRLSEMVGRRLRSAGRRGRGVSGSVVYRPDTACFFRQLTLGNPIAAGDEIYRAALALLAGRDMRRAVGTLGVGLAGLTDP